MLRQFNFQFPISNFQLRNFIIIALISVLFLTPTVRSQTVDDLNQQLKSKQEQIKELESKINLYQKNITVKQKEIATLGNQLSILQSRIDKTGLEVLVNEAKTADLILLLESLGEEIAGQERKIAEQKKLLGGLLQKFYLKKQKNYLELILTDVSFAEYFDDLRYVSELAAKIDQALDGLQVSRQELTRQRGEVSERQQLLSAYQNQLKERHFLLSEQKTAKDILLKETKLSEVKFKALADDLRAEFEAQNRQALQLQREIEKKLFGREFGDNVLIWPVSAHNGISAAFHDPSYPFRYLFEHSGIDLRLPSGTPVQAAASGYVAWAKTGRLYGNNIMIVHPNNLVSIYAHLSRFSVVPNTLVERGQVIGFSGGVPGTPGAGLSTGPHLHFEVRVNGRPQDPMSYAQ